MAFRAREAEIYSQTTMGPDGKHKMKPAARAALAKRLTPVRVLSPMAADRLETLGARRVEYLADHAPKRPDAMARVVGPERWQPSAFQLAEFARRVAALEDPAATYERMVDGTLTKEDAECMQAVYPEMFKAGRDEIIRRLPELRASLPYQRRVMLSLFTGVPVDPAMDPMVLQVLQQAYVEEPGTEGGTQAPTPKPAFGSVSKPEPTPGQERSSGRTSIA